MQHSYFPYEPTQQLRIDTQSREIKVIGEGTASALPDEISMTIGTRTEKRDVQEALKENSAVSNTLLQEIKKLGINDQQIETASFTINPKYDY
ncbi:MAG: SIMPL domain-containing protein, partial [Priestia megaterium]